MFLRRDKSQMISAEDALPGRDSRPFSVPARHYVLDAPLEPPFPEGTQQAIFALGCFWGAERKFWETPGVYTTAVGYAGGVHTQPHVRRGVQRPHRSHRSGARRVRSRSRSAYETLLKVFWESHDPTQGMRQGNDVGTQYRSGIYVFDDEQKKAAEASREMFEERLKAAGFADDHDRDPRRADLLLRGGLPPAVPGEEPDGLLRPRRHRRQLPHRCPRRVAAHRIGSADRGGRRGRPPGNRRVRRLHAQAVESTARRDTADARRRRPRGVARSQRTRGARGSRRRLPAALAAAQPPVLGDA